jgi:dihydropyrimidine dehydrogenase (NAD+) subunit PreT
MALVTLESKPALAGVSGTRRVGPSADSPSARACGVHAARLNLADYAERFGDSVAPLNAVQARIEAERCYGCHDAPCIAACPTAIDIPSFIHRIAQDNLRGAARAILEANPLGGMCARVCPTDILCEGACVRHTNEDKPVEIGLLQRFATDALMASSAPPLFKRAPATGRRVAVVGAGPAGLACAHGLALRGHEVTVFDAQAKAGGLNEYGIASYKTVDNFAQREVQWLLSIGGIHLALGRALGRDLSLDSLLQQHDAVFLGLGLAGVNALGLPEPAGQGLALRDAVAAIADIRQSQDLAQLPVGRHVVVIGGGMTAVDAAVQSALLGAETVHMVYRRGPEAMGASAYEQRWAQQHGVQIHHWAAPADFELDASGHITSMRFVRTRLDAGRLVQTDESFKLHADQVLRAIGQTMATDGLPGTITLQGGRIATDADGCSSLPRVWAGGDCRAGGRDLTVEAVEHGKRSAVSIHHFLSTLA